MDRPAKIGPEDSVEHGIELWRAGEAIEFFKAQLDQDVVDQFIVDGVIERVWFDSCRFDRPIDFRGATFLGTMVLDRCVFGGRVNFAGCAFPGGGSVAMAHVRMEEGGDFSGVDFGERRVSLKPKPSRGSWLFDDALLGDRFNFGGEFDGPVSFRGATLANNNRFIALRFGSTLDLSATLLRAGAAIQFQGINRIPAFHDEEQFVADGLRWEGSVTISGGKDEEPIALRSLETGPKPGEPIPLRTRVRVEFNAGPLTGSSYLVGSPVGLSVLLRRLGGSHAMTVSRTDIDHSIKIEHADGLLYIQSAAIGGTDREPVPDTERHIALRSALEPPAQA